jgi:nucleoside-diphosphate-sugar epimerase
MLHRLNDGPRLPDRIVIIGAGGFVGGAVVRRLREAGAAVLGITRADVDLALPGAGQHLAKLLRAEDAVVAVAAKAPCRTVADLAENAAIIRSIVEMLRAVPASHLVNISSDAVYADGPLPLTETSPLAPTSLHGVMHLAREIALAGELPGPLAILRPTLVYGASDPHNGYGPNQFRRKANRGGPITLFGEGEERRDHVAVNDVAELVYRVLSHRSVGSLNIATGTVTSFRGVAELAVSASGHAVAIEGSPRRGPMPHGGYRSFDPAATFAAFPDFRFTLLRDGMQQAQIMEFGSAPFQPARTEGGA